MAASVIGSVIPDLDEQHAVASRKIEHVERLVAILLIVAAMVTLHLATNPIMWLLLLLVLATLSIQANIARRIALLMFAVGVLYMSTVNSIPVFAGVLFALWCIGAMFARHRTFTHSIVGFILFTVAAFASTDQYHFGLLGYEIAIGYLFHILADMVAGGTKLLWPLPLVSKKHNLTLFEQLPNKIEILLVYTGSVIDQVIGAVSLALFLIIAIF